MMRTSLMGPFDDPLMINAYVNDCKECTDVNLFWICMCENAFHIRKIDDDAFPGNHSCVCT